MRNGKRPRWPVIAAVSASTLVLAVGAAWMSRTESTPRSTGGTSTTVLAARWPVSETPM